MDADEPATGDGGVTIVDVKIARLRPKRREQTRAKVFTAAMRLLNGRSADSLSVDEIAAEAGVAKGSLYYNFGSKRDMFQQLLVYGTNLLVERLESTVDLPGLLAEAFAFAEDHPAFSQLWVAEVWLSPTHDADVLTSLRRDLLGLLTDRLDIDGHLRPGVEPVAILGAILLLARDRRLFTPARTREQCVEAILALLR